MQIKILLDLFAPLEPNSILQPSGSGFAGEHDFAQLRGARPDFVDELFADKLPA
jgi:hypothetical protein